LGQNLVDKPGNLKNKRLILRLIPTGFKKRKKKKIYQSTEKILHALKVQKIQMPLPRSKKKCKLILTQKCKKLFYGFYKIGFFQKLQNFR